MADTYKAYMDTPMGPFCIQGDDEAIVSAGFVRERGVDSPGLPGHMTEGLSQLEEYFAGERVSFDIPLGGEGTDFQKEVWSEMCSIPSGETRSYGLVAKAIGRPGGARAVGQACASNPIGLIQPCHRVVGHDGGLVGFGHQARDLRLKRRLIEHEATARTAELEEFQG